MDRMKRTNEFKRRRNRRKKVTITHTETVGEYLARGGKITKVPPCFSAALRTPAHARTGDWRLLRGSYSA